MHNYRRLYLSHLLTSWVDRSFEFASYLLISKIYTNSLLQSSLYGLTTTLAALVFSHRLGNWINILSRINTFRITLLGQKASIIFSTLLFHFLYNNSLTINNINNNNNSKSTLHTTDNVLYGIIIFLGCTLKLFFIANSIAIEKDWAMILSNGHLEILLPTMRRIDLVCKTISPIFMGFLLLAPQDVLTIVMITWTGISACVEYWLISTVHDSVPALKVRGPIEVTVTSETVAVVGEGEEVSVMATTTAEAAASEIAAMNGTTTTTTTTSSIPAAIVVTDEGDHAQELDSIPSQPTPPILSTPSSLPLPLSASAYIHHKTFLATLALAMLYINVLSFGGTMTSYLSLIGYNSGLLGLMKALAGIFGVVATYIFPILSRKIGNVRTGLWAIWQFTLTLCVVMISLSPTILENQPVLQGILLFGGMATSRLGLWIFDLAESLVIQEMTSGIYITSLTGWQFSLCNFFDLTQFALTMIVSDPAKFMIPASISVGVIGLAAMVYTRFVWMDRGHLLHHLKLK